jgi:hypothetical protein
LKAKLCVEGMRLSYEYLAKNGIPYKKCGKLIVAVKPSEISGLKELFERGLKNNVAGLKLIDGQQIKQYEPHCKVQSFSILNSLAWLGVTCFLFLFPLLLFSAAGHISFQIGAWTLIHFIKPYPPHTSVLFTCVPNLQRKLKSCLKS